MAKYKIYDNKSNVITPSNEEFTAEEWLKRYPWARLTKMIVGGGVINGAVALVFDDYVDAAKRAGCDFSNCTTDEEYLAAIEEFEDIVPEPMVDTTALDLARIADALEDRNVLAMPDVE